MELSSKFLFRPVNYNRGEVDFALILRDEKLDGEIRQALGSGGKVILRGTEIIIAPRKGDGSRWKMHDVLQLGKEIDDTPVFVGRTYVKI